MHATDSRDAAGSWVRTVCRSIQSSNGTRCTPHASHLISQCPTSSTSPLSHNLHTLSFLATPLHLPVSISKPAVPPLSFVIILLLDLLHTLAHSDHSPKLTILFNISNLGFVSISLPYSSRTFLQAMASSISLTSTADNSLNTSTLTSFHPNCPQHILILPIQVPPPNLTLYSRHRLNVLIGVQFDSNLQDGDNLST